MAEQHNWSEGFRLVAGPRVMGLSEATPETQGYWDGVMRNELMVKRCGHCQRMLHPRRHVCSQCGTTELEWVKSAGAGEVYSYSVMYRAPTPAFEGSLPYALGIVKLDEGVYLFGRIYTKGDREPEIGMRVKADYRVLETGQKLPVYLEQE